MGLKFFTDPIDVLGKVADSLKTIVNLIKTDRETIQKPLGKIFATMLNMVIIPLADIQLRCRRRIPQRGRPARQRK